MRDNPDFYLSSADDYTLSSPRKCWRIRRLRDEVRDDWLLIRVDPPLHGWVHPRADIGEGEFSYIIVGARHVGVSLFPIREWPVHVYVVVPLVDRPDSLQSFSADQCRLVSWAELYPTEEAARNRGMLGDPAHRSPPARE